MPRRQSCQIAIAGIVSFPLPELDGSAGIHEPPDTAIQPKRTVGGARDTSSSRQKLDSRAALRSDARGYRDQKLSGFLQPTTRKDNVRIMKNFISLTVTTVLLALSNLSAGTLFVCPESTNPVPPFANWATAATNIQQAVNAAAAGDDVVVTNGIYGAVNVDKPLLLRSVNGPKVTIIDPVRRGRCAWLTNGTSLAGFWLRHGAADVFGGGVFCASSDVFLTNCVITDNSVYTNSNGSVIGSGGGVYGGTLYNCLVASNSAAVSGGGAIASTLYNCTVTGNHADRYGGGVYSSAATNCIVYFNTAVPPYNNHGLAQLRPLLHHANADERRRQHYQCAAVR